MILKRTWTPLNRLRRINPDFADYLSTNVRDNDDGLHDLRELMRVCDRCILSATRNHVSLFDGEIGASIMVIGEGPGFLEDLCGIPIAGPAELKSSHCNGCSKCAVSCYDHKLLAKVDGWGKRGKKVTCSPNYTGSEHLNWEFYLKSTGSILDGILVSKWGYQFPRHNWVTKMEKETGTISEIRSPWFITNAVSCRTTDVGGIKDKTPEGISVTRCKDWLQAQWAFVNPRISIVLGRSALESILGKKAAIGVSPNTIIQSSIGPIIFQNHPAYFMRMDNDYTKAYGFGRVASTFEKALVYAGLLDDI